MAWTTPSTRSTGTLITASIWNTDLTDNLIYLKGVADAVDGYSVVYKSADESLNTNTTVQSDDALLWAVAENEVYRFDMMLIITAANTTMDFKCQFSLPAGATMFWGHHGANGAVGAPAGFLGMQSVASTQDPAMTEATTGVLTSTLAGTQIVVLEGIVLVSSTAGNVNFQWAQSTSNGSNLTVKAGSNIVLHRLA